MTNTPPKGETPRQAEHHETEQGHEVGTYPHPHIWIASLADYVSGRLHGAWIDATQTPEQLETAARAILASSPEAGAEEWAIHDYDGFGTLRLGEYESFETVSIIGRGIAKHGPAFAAWIDQLQDNGETITENLLDDFTDHYLGHHDSLAAWGEESCDELGYTQLAGSDLPATIASYVTIDHEMLARDMEIDGEITSTQAEGGGVWVFRT